MCSYRPVASDGAFDGELHAHMDSSGNELASNAIELQAIERS